MRNKKTIAVAAAALSGALLAAGCSSGSSGAGSNSGTDWSKVTSVAQGGGMKALIAAAKKEGELNVIVIPSDASYAAIARRSTQYTSRSMTRTLTAPAKTRSTRWCSSGQSRAPDVLDMGTAFAIKADQQRLLAKYQVSEWSDIPAAEKSSDGTWYGDYGGYVAIGYDSKKVKVPPTSLKDLAKPIYKHQVAINGNPTEASAAFSAVYAAALANGGSLGNITPGVAFFATLKKDGNFCPGHRGADDRPERQTPIVVWWDYLLASEISATDPNFKIVSLVMPATPPTTTRRSTPTPRTRPRARLGGVPPLGDRPEPVAAGQGQAGGAADHGRKRNRGQGGQRRPASSTVHPAAVPDAGPGVSRRGHRRQAVGSQSRRMTTHAANVAAPAPAPESGAAARRRSLTLLRRARDLAGVVPFTVYVLLGLVLPMGAILIGAFKTPLTGKLTLSNIHDATHGIYLHGFGVSMKLSLIASIVPGILGFLIAYAISRPTRRGACAVAITASRCSRTRRCAARVPVHSHAGQHRPGDPVAGQHRIRPVMTTALT